MEGMEGMEDMEDNVVSITMECNDHFATFHKKDPLICEHIIVNYDRFKKKWICPFCDTEFVVKD